MAKLTTSTTRNLYSLNDKPVIVDMGIFGNWTINPKPEGAPWGVTIIEDRVMSKDFGEDKFEPHTSTATECAEDIIHRYDNEGFFLAAIDDAPSPEEVAAAELQFQLADEQRIATAHTVWDAKKDRSKIDVRARDAARRRHQVVDWATNQAVSLRACPFCSENIRASAAKCRFCGEWLDGRAQNTATAAAPAVATVATDDGDVNPNFSEQFEKIKKLKKAS